jgi:hypothetical protein
MKGDLARQGAAECEAIGAFRFFRPSSGFICRNEWRTQIAKEVPMETVIKNVIRMFNGYGYAVAGVVIGFFDDPAQAQACAFQIINLTHYEVDVFGSQLIMVL